MRRSTDALLFGLLLAGCVAPEGTVVGRVTWAGTAEGEGITVTLVGPVTRAVVTDLEGTWAAAVPPGDYAAIAEAAGTREGRTSTTVVVTDRHRAEAEPMTLTRVGRIRGVVTRAGATDHAGTFVMVVGGAGSAVTDTAGGFLLEDLPTGLRDLVAFADGYEKRPLTGVEVRRGQTADAPPLSLTPVAAGDLPKAGRLSGRAWLPGTDDHSGIEVRVAGTARATVTAVDGTFTFDDVPTGVAALSFKKGGWSAELPRVLVVAGGTGFIIDKGLYDLGTRPVPLRLGTRVLDATASITAVSPGGAWTVLQTGSPSRLWLYGPDGVARPMAADLTLSSTLGFVGGAYWFTSYDAKAAEYSLNQTVLADQTTRAFAKLPNLIDTRFAPMPSGAAWVHRRILHLKASAAGPVTQKFEGQASSVLSLGDDTVLVAATTAVHHVALDGTVLDSTPITPAADWLLLSPDQRWLVVGSGGIAGKPLSNAVVLVDRVLQKQQPLTPCYSAAFSPDSDVLACEQDLHRLHPDGSLTRRTVGPHFSYGAQLWLGNGRVAVGMPPELRIVSAGAPDLTVSGFSYDTTTLTLSADKQRVRFIAHADPVTGLAEALELTLATGALKVLAEGIATRPFLANDRGVLIGRPRSVGTDLDLFFVPDVGPEVELGRSTRNFTSYLSSSPGATYFGARRFAPGRGYESVVLDTRAQANPVLPVALMFAYDRWLDDHRLLQSVTGAAPFSDATGLYLVQLP